MKLQRPLNHKEVKILDARLKRLNKLRRNQILFLFIYLLIGVGVAAFVFSEKVFDVSGIYILAGIAAYGGIAIWAVGEDLFSKQKQRKSIEFLKSKNLVTVMSIQSNRYYELKEDEDEGVFYLFQLPGDKVLSFGGQNFYSDDGFPSDGFEIVEGRVLNGEVVLLEKFNYGKKIEPKKIIAGRQKWDLFADPAFPNPDGLTIVDGKIEDFLPTRKAI